MNTYRVTFTDGSSQEFTGMNEAEARYKAGNARTQPIASVTFLR